MSRNITPKAPYRFKTYDELLHQFEQEYEYYTEHNRYDLGIGDRVSISKHVNVQLIMTYFCKNACPFCYESSNKTEDLNYKPVKILEQTAKLLSKMNLKSDISITGGEPTEVDEEFLKTIVDGISATNKCRRISMNSCNFSGTKYLNYMQGLNVSIHSIDPVPWFETPQVPEGDKKKITLQKLIFDTDDWSSLKEYMEYYMSLGFTSFSFRGKYGEGENFLKVLNQLDDIDFIQQKIGDHFIYEHYKYKGCFVRFTYADVGLLEKLNNVEDVPFVRSIQIYPSGVVGFNWDVNDTVVL